MKRIAPTFFIAGLAFSLVACTDTRDPAPPTLLSVNDATTGPVKQPGEGYTLRPTDLLHIEMYMEPDIRSDVSVSPEGDIALPGLPDRTHVEGLTLKQTRQVLTEKYKKYFKEPSLTLLITRYAERKVYVTGFVNQPGPVVFPPEENMTITRAIAAARDVQPRGDRGNVTITRTINGQTKTYKVDLDDISRGRAPDVEIRENDSIFVADSKI